MISKNQRMRNRAQRQKKRIKSQFTTEQSCTICRKFKDLILKIITSNVCHWSNLISNECLLLRHRKEKIQKAESGPLRIRNTSSKKSYEEIKPSRPLSAFSKILFRTNVLRKTFFKTKESHLYPSCQKFRKFRKIKK
jgi:hypothetical protein